MNVVDVFGETISIQSGRRPVRPVSPVENHDDPFRRLELFTVSTIPSASQPWIGDPDNPGLYEPVPEFRGSGDILLFVPAVQFREESPPLEEIRFLRDEGANMIWGVERTVLNGMGRPVAGFDAQHEYHDLEHQAEIMELIHDLVDLAGKLANPKLSPQLRQKWETEQCKKKAMLERLRNGPPPQKAEGIPVYRLMSDVPENWIPFQPVQFHSKKDPDWWGIRLRRAQMLINEDDEAPLPVPALSSLLDPKRVKPLDWLEETSVPRAGVRVVLTAQRLRWFDGKTYTWLGRKVLTGRGEGSSGLKFDVLR